MSPAPADCPIQDQQTKSWHLDRKVPITLIVILVGHIGYGIVQWTEMKARVSALETETLQQRARDDKQDRQRADDDKLVREQLQTLDRKVDRVLDFLLQTSPRNPK